MALNTIKLRQIGQESSQFKAISEVLASRRRTRKVTDLRQFHYKLMDETNAPITIEDVMSYFKKLQTAGVGTVVFGRGGNPTRFKWNYSIKKVGQAVHSGKTKPAASVKEENLSPVVAKSKKPLNYSRKLTEEIQHTLASALPKTLQSQNIQAYVKTNIKLSNGLEARLEIPIGLSESDSDQLISLIKEFTQKKSRESVVPKSVEPKKPVQTILRRASSQSASTESKSEEKQPEPAKSISISHEELTEAKKD